VQTGVFVLDRNNVTGDLQSACDLPSIQLAIADCDVICICCDLCCTDGEDCHDLDLVSNISPVWELEYKRQFFGFSDKMGNYNVGDDDDVANLGDP
jgi:hypothetical protein